MPRDSVIQLVLLLFVLPWGGLLARHAWMRRHTPGAIAFIGMVLSATLWAACDSVIVWGVPWWVERALLTITFSCMGGLLIGWVSFALEFTGRRDLINRRRIALAAVVPVATVILVATSGMHDLVWRARVGEGIQHSESGPALHVFLAYAATMCLIGAATLVQTLLSAAPARRTAPWVVLFAGLLPWAADLVNFVMHRPNEPRSIVPFTFVVSGPLLAWGLFRLRILEVMPLARDRVFLSMAEGVLVLDHRERIADINPAASRLLAVHGRNPPGLGELAGLPEDLGLAPCDPGQSRGARDWVIHDGREQRVLELRRKKLLDGRGVSMGSLVFLRDVTGKRAGERERERLIGEFRNACSRERTLSGLLPICAACKQVRDNHGAWLPLGTFLRTHSEARPTAVVCPDCLKSGEFQT